MSQHLIIRKFGPIDEVSIEVKDILIFIGPQASGKSTISKAIFFFKSLRDDLISYLIQSDEKQRSDYRVTNFADIAKQKFIKIYGYVLQFPKMYLEYDYGNGMKIIVDNFQYTRVNFDEKFQDTFQSLVRISKNLYEQKESLNSIFASSGEISASIAREKMLLDRIINEVNSLFNEDRDILFLPAGRSLITTLSQQRDNIDLGDNLLSKKEYENSEPTKLDYLMQHFIYRIDNAKRSFSQDFNYIIQEAISRSKSQKDESAIKASQELIQSILKGTYRYQNGFETLDFDEGKSVSINFASSGQQEVVWILLLILLLIINQRKVFLFVEEPEAHLFPVAQNQIIDLIALLSNQNGEMNQMILTTHSPYILSSFNNLLYAYNLGQKKPEEVDKIVERHFWIDPDRLDAYILEDGKARSILDSEMGLLESGEIDRISDIMVDTFDRLFELEDAE